MAAHRMPRLTGDVAEEKDLGKVEIAKPRDRIGASIAG